MKVARGLLKVEILEFMGARYFFKQKEGTGMLVNVRWNKETQILLLSGRFDKAARVPLETALADGEGHPRNKVVLDFSNVSSMDSAGIGKVLLLYHSLRKKGVALTVMNPRPLIEELLHFVNFATFIPILHHHPDVRSVA